MEVNGLPLHALVTHAAVVLGPLSALAGVAYAVVPPWRDWLRWPLLGLALAALASIWAAYLSGEQLESANTYGGALAPLVETHESRAGILRWSMTGFAVVAVAASVLHARLRRSGAVGVGLAVAVGLLGVLTLVYCVLTGDAGAQIAWYGTDV